MNLTAQKLEKEYKSVLGAYQSIIDTLNRLEPYQDAFLKSERLTIEDYKNMDYKQKNIIDEKWRSSEYYKQYKLSRSDKH